jgi:DNA-binding transcriptional ArsR family regulator
VADDLEEADFPAGRRDVAGDGGCGRAEVDRRDLGDRLVTYYAGMEVTSDAAAADDAVFKALADHGRRLLLDALFARDGQTLGELCRQLPEMTRFGVMKHLGVLEQAHLVVTHRSGRVKHHYLNPVPIREIHDRWITKYAQPVAAAMVGLRQRLEDPTA